MTLCAKDPSSVFVGQAVQVEGTGISKTLDSVPLKRRIELPVDEDFQLGLSIGLALDGLRVVSIFPRWNFLLLATNQLINHLDKLNELGIFLRKPIIIRTAIGAINPLNPGPQHIGDFSEPFRQMCKNVNVVRLDDKTQILPEYEKALTRKDHISSLLVEWSDKYGE